MFCKKCGKEILDEAVICIHCGCSVDENKKENTPDSSSTGMAVLGFFIPLAGLIIWLINKETKPLMAKSAGRGALVGFIVSTVFSIVYGVVLGSMLGSMMYW